jgi:hypothetical protein
LLKELLRDINRAVHREEWIGNNGNKIDIGYVFMLDLVENERCMSGEMGRGTYSEIAGRGRGLLKGKGGRVEQHAQHIRLAGLYDMMCVFIVMQIFNT